MKDLVLPFAAVLVAILAVAAWLTFFVVALDEDCGRLNKCDLPPDTLYVAAWSLTALTLILGFAWLRRWVVRGRASQSRP